MRGLSLTQPWASAMALGLKEWETRSWSTSYRGYVAIHAAKGFPGWAKDFALGRRRDHSQMPSVAEMPRGCIVAIGEIVDCQATSKIRTELTTLEQQWGDYADGRFAFKFNLIRMVVPTVPCKGSLGFWQVPEDVWVEIRKKLTAVGEV